MKMIAPPATWPSLILFGPFESRILWLVARLVCFVGKSPSFSHPMTPRLVGDFGMTLVYALLRPAHSRIWKGESFGGLFFPTCRADCWLRLVEGRHPVSLPFYRKCCDHNC